MNNLVLDKETLRFGRLLHYAGLAVVLILGVAAHVWLYVPVENSILDAEMRIDELTQSKRNSAVILREHRRLAERLRQIEKRYAALRRRVPNNVEAGSFLKVVSDIAREEQLSINNFQPAHSAVREGYAAMEVMLNGTGSFASMCSFFDRLSKIERLSKVKDVTITADGVPRGAVPMNLPKLGARGAAVPDLKPDKYPLKATLIIYSGLQSEPAASAQKGTKRG
jgi:Tfp pilus assembly protein PilO